MNIPCEVFLWNIFNMEGRFSKILKYRYILIGEYKGTPDEQKEAHKFSTPAIDKWLREKEDRMSEYELDVFGSTLSNIIAGNHKRNTEKR